MVSDEAGGGVVVQEDGGRLNVAELELLVANGDDFPLSVLVDRVLPGDGLLHTSVEVDVVAGEAVLDLVDLVTDRGDVPISVGVGRLLPGDQAIGGVVVQELAGLDVLDADGGLGEKRHVLVGLLGKWMDDVVDVGAVGGPFYTKRTDTTCLRGGLAENPHIVVCP